MVCEQREQRLRVGNDRAQAGGNELLELPFLRFDGSTSSIPVGTRGAYSEDDFCVRTHADEYRIAAVTFPERVSC